MAIGLIATKPFLCFLDKNILIVWKKNIRFNYEPKLCQNAALLLNGMYLNIPTTEFPTLCRAASSSGTAWVGSANTRSLAPWAIISISRIDDTTGPHQTFMAWSTIVALISVYYILISSQSLIRLLQIDMQWIIE